MQTYFNLLGYKCRDKVTGREGIITSICFDLFGCVQLALTPEMDKEGKLPDSHWFDAKRMTKISESPSMVQPNFDVSAGKEIGANSLPEKSKQLPTR